MYFLVVFEPTGERAIYQNGTSDNEVTVKDLLQWIIARFRFEKSTGEVDNRRLSLLYDNTELQPQWFLQDVNVHFGATVKCLVREGRHSRASL